MQSLLKYLVSPYALAYWMSPSYENGLDDIGSLINLALIILVTSEAADIT